MYGIGGMVCKCQNRMGIEVGIEAYKYSMQQRYVSSIGGRDYTDNTPATEGRNEIVQQV